MSSNDRSSYRTISHPWDRPLYLTINLRPCLESLTSQRSLAPHSKRNRHPT